ncbi:MAG: FAD-dependent oxidoreductase [Deferrisomatales bacterium]
MEQYWDCSLCRVENKAKALRCRGCSGKLRGRDRLVHETQGAGRARRTAALLSALAPGAGQMYQGRWLTGAVLAVLVPLAGALVAATWNGFTYGHAFLLGAAVFVMAVAAADAWIGPRVARAPCQETCPAGLDIPDYLQLIVDGDYEQGYALVRTRVPLVGVIGRICPHPCESRCVRGIDGEPIAINACKRFLADGHRDVARRRAQEKRRGVVLVDGGRPSVAVVGSGPAGLACAYYASVLGASVTVYEAAPVVGGRLATTIPDYRLPPGILHEELEDLRNRGVRFLTQAPVGPDGRAIERLLGEHDAVFLAVGAGRSAALQTPGEGTFLDFQDVLTAVKLGQPVDLGRKVAVVGGGNAAMDVCRTAVRLGVEQVHLLYRRSREEMPARPDEVEEAQREGVQIHFLSDPVETCRGDGGTTRLRIRRMRLGPPDASGRPVPVPVEGEDWWLEVDAVVPAIGQAVAGPLFHDPALASLRRHPDGRIWVDPTTQRTSCERIYAGGDAVGGASTAVEAMAHGRTAALAIYVAHGPGGRRLRLTDKRIRKPFLGHRETPQARIREEMPKLPARSRVDGFREVEEGFREAAACREAGRCLQCHREL